MKLPARLTAFVSGLVGSWAGGLLAGLLVVPMVYGADRAHHDLSQVWIVLSLGSALAQAGGQPMALVLIGLLPSMSGIRVGFGTALVATICGYLVSTILLAALLPHAAIYDNVAATGGAGALPALGFASLLLPIAGIAVTTWMITSSAGAGGGGGDKSHLYPASFYDDMRRRGDNRGPARPATAAAMMASVPVSAVVAGIRGYRQLLSTPTCGASWCGACSADCRWA